MKELEIYIDGASKGNPGPSGIGVVVCQGGETIKNIANYIGNTTNNIAEYTALIYGLQEGLLLKAENITVKTDSQLLYRQLKKIYKVKNPNILELYNQVTHLIAAFAGFSINHIPREENKGADKLANQAVKQALKKK
ncbi:MAG: ribonuclease HI family protein [Candidatus Omnitrophota bacterium]